MQVSEKNCGKTCLDRQIQNLLQIVCGKTLPLMVKTGDHNMFLIFFFFGAECKLFYP